MGRTSVTQTVQLLQRLHRKLHHNYGILDDVLTVAQHLGRAVEGREVEIGNSSHRTRDVDAVRVLMAQRNAWLGLFCFPLSQFKMVNAGRLGLHRILSRMHDFPLRCAGHISGADLQCIAAEQVAVIGGHAVLADGFPVHGRIKK